MRHRSCVRVCHTPAGSGSPAGAAVMAAPLWVSMHGIPYTAGDSSAAQRYRHRPWPSPQRAPVLRRADESGGRCLDIAPTHRDVVSRGQGRTASQICPSSNARTVTQAFESRACIHTVEWRDQACLSAYWSMHACGHCFAWASCGEENSSGIVVCLGDFWSVPICGWSPEPLL